MKLLMTALFSVLLSTLAFARTPQIVRSVNLGKVFVGSNALIVGSDLLYTPTKNFASANQDARLVLENLESGVQKWSVPLDSLAEKILVRSSTAFVMTFVDTLYAIDLSTGRELWKKQTSKADSMLDSFSLRKDGTLHYKDSADTHHQILSPTTGKSIEVIEAQGRIADISDDGSLLIAIEGNGGIHSPSDTRVKILKTSKEGSLIWKQDDFYSPAYLFQLDSTLSGGAIGLQYISMSHPDQNLKRRFHVFILNENGEKIFQQMTHGEYIYLAEQQSILVIDEDGKTLHSISTLTGQTKWTQPTTLTNLLSFSIMNQTVALEDDTKLQVIDVNSGLIQQELKFADAGIEHATLLASSVSNSVLSTYNAVTKSYILNVLKY